MEKKDWLFGFLEDAGVIEVIYAEDAGEITIDKRLVADCADCGKELRREDVAYHEMESDTGAWHYYCSDCAPRSYFE